MQESALRRVKAGLIRSQNGLASNYRLRRAAIAQGSRAPVGGQRGNCYPESGAAERHNRGGDRGNNRKELRPTRPTVSLSRRKTSKHRGGNAFATFCEISPRVLYQQGGVIDCCSIYAQNACTGCATLWLK